MDEVEERVRAIIASVIRVPAEKLTLDSDLKADFGIDSLLGLQIVARIEKEYGVLVPEEEIDCYTSVRSIVTTLRGLKSG